MVGTNIILFVSFPKNKEVRLKWINALKRKDWQNTKWTKLCSAHFREMDIDQTSKSCVRLREGAVTAIFPAISSTVDRASSKRKIDKGESSQTFSYEQSPTKKLKTELAKSKIRLKSYKTKIKTLQTKKRRLEKKVANLANIIKALREKKGMSEESCSLLSSLSKTSSCLVQRCLKKENNTFKKTYEDRLKAFAITLQFLSPKAYSFVRRTFNTALPHPRTLRRSYSSVNAAPGFCTEVLEH